MTKSYVADDLCEAIDCLARFKRNLDRLDDEDRDKILSLSANTVNLDDVVEKLGEWHKQMLSDAK